MAVSGAPRDDRTAARLFFGLLLVTTALLQATFLPTLNLMSVLPDFSLVLLLLWSATHGVFEGLCWAFGLGVWLDIVSMELIGAHSLALMIVALVGGLTRGKLFRSGAILPLVTVIVATLGYNVVVLLMDSLAGSGTDAVSFVRLALMTSLLNALLVPLAYGVMLVFDRWAPRRV
ncbi:MAG TPA: rod shape-determining protein MreD [Thermomicrobiales bacterium]|nr:rod shape-determining protein MreD [Thermomicrobiales bacterium]